MDIVAFVPSGDYEGNTRRRMLAAVAAKLGRRGRGEKMLCVDRPVCPLSTPVKHPGKYLEWLAGRRGLRRVQENVWAWTPWVLIHDIVALKRPAIERLNMKLVRRGLDAVLDKIGMTLRSDLVLWIFHPYQVEYLQLMPAALRVYECWDDHQEFPAVKADAVLRQWIGELERRICEEADLVFATSAALARKMSAMHSNVVMCANGVDFEHFNAAVPTEQCDPVSPKGNSPRIGFVGKINEKLDLSILDTISARRPEWTFTMVGPFDGQPELQSATAYKRVKARDNVHLLGQQPYDRIPAIVSTFDVCTIPFAVNALTEATYPLKLHEYLATGKPVVSTDLPDVRQFSDVVYIARNAREFEQMTEKALAEDSPELQEHRIQTARENSWENRAQAILKAMRRARHTPREEK